jgi:hypothetical protein
MQDKQNRTSITGQTEINRNNRKGRTDKQKGTGRTGQIIQDSQNKTARTEQPGKECQYRAARTGLSGTGLPGQGCLDRATRIELP